MKVGSKVVNDTLIFNQHFNNMLPENWQNQLDSAFENAYMYGRDLISKMVRICVLFQFFFLLENIRAHC